MSQRTFFDLRHAQRYLNSCVVLKNGRPIYILGTNEGIDGAYQISYLYTSEDNNQQAMLTFLKNDLSVDFTPIKLGMCMYRSRNKKRLKTFYLSRLPARMWKVGLTSENLGVHHVVEDKNYALPPANAIIWSQNFEDMVRNKYRPYAEAFDLHRVDKGNEVPISKRFAINNYQLYYKTLIKPVGIAVKKQLTLFDNFKYLHESLKEDMPNEYT